MNYYTKEALKSSIENKTELVELKSGEATAIVSEYGGRLLALFPRSECYNLLWINSDPKSVITSRERAIGGDRYWISPERDFFYKDPENWAGWECPKSLDPANYEILASSKKLF